MSVKIIDTLKPKNNGSFPIVEAVDVAVSEELRLPAALAAKADVSDLAAIGEDVAGKANASDVATATANLQGQIDQIEISATAEAVVAPEVAGARVNSDGVSFGTLKARCDSDFSAHTDAEREIYDTIGEISESLGEQTKTDNLSLTWTSGYVGTDGVSHSGDSMHYSNKIYVQEGDEINSNYNYRFVAAFDKYGVAVPAKGDDSGSNKTYTVPSGIASVILTEYTGHTATITHTKTREAITAKDDAARSQVENVSATVNTVTEDLGTATETTTLTITWTSGYMGTDGDTHSSDSMHYSNMISVNTGDVVSSDRNFRFVAAFDSDDLAVPAKGYDVGDTKSYTVPSGISKIVISQYTTPSSIIQKTITYEIISAKDLTARNSVNDVAEAVGAEYETYRKTSSLDLTWGNGYIGPDGVVHESDSFHYSNPISVNEGDVIFSDRTFRFVAAFDADMNAVPAAGDSSGLISSYTVPSGIASVIVTEYSEYSSNISRTYTTTGYVVKGSQLDTHRVSGNLASGDSFKLPGQNINKKTVESFSAEITTFSKIEIGRGNGGGSGYYIEIDDTNITIHKDAVASEPIPHGLTIENDIQVKITSRTDGTENPRNFRAATFRITSNGYSFDTSDPDWLASLGTPFVKSVGSSLHDCSFSFQSLDANKLVYAYGDSYFSWYPERWVYYMALDGYADNVFTNAYAGQATVTALTALKNTINLGKPRFILWCLGMNDGSDTLDAPSAAWKIGIDTVLSICNQYGITPIFATIPTVPQYNHEKKNEWIRSSGHRYVDFAKAVGSSSAGVWYTGMLADGVHPTEEGAKALYNRLLCDFPEIMAE